MLVPEPGAPRPPILLAYGFRPFFLGAGLYALIAVLLWLFALDGHGVLPQRFAPAVWHGHEMLFGFIGAAIGGFLLTAVPNWTTTAPATGAWLALPVGAWLAGRLAMLGADFLPPLAVAGLDLAFFPVLTWVISRAILHTLTWKHAPFPGLLVALFVANLLVHLDVAGGVLGLKLAAYLIALLVALISGRIVPNFTRNALAGAAGGPSVTTPRWVERAALLTLVLLAAADMSDQAPRLIGALAFTAGVLFLWRMAGWRTGRVLDQPLLWSLHLGHFWLGLGLVFVGLAQATGWVSVFTAWHAVFIGAFATLILAVMTRAALGHSGRPLEVGRAIVFAYLLLSAATLARAFGPALAPAATSVWVVTAGGFWLAAFAVFVAVYWPILTRPRIDGRPG